ncbi:ATP-dependent metalloprotease, FtsH family protein [Plesiocystis pacifica SIR-1]|uniref:ATP-dependent metalloprotease, FtsH family protein n=1 Tax=Plesiocystis pacifica SIR-1 TaxID=391625 RepID=A6GJW0_9BACT|nr:AAA family ATPase [Plesiocystis pacifica]EDM73839.1 ATP-dependent metalloprotease, FtsH family protein [Plesiocystis pacifica SIR-1]
MSRTVSEDQLPESLTPAAAVIAAYPDELARAGEALLRGLPVLVECDKGLVGYFYSGLRKRLRKQGIRCNYIDGRVPAEAGAMPMGLVPTMIGQLRDAVRGGTHGEDQQRRVMVLPHLDLLTTSTGALTSEAREVVALLYENPNILWLGFRDPSFPLPKVIANLFQHRISIVGIARERLAHLVTKREARKLAERPGLDVYKLYKQVSGVHAIRLRQLLDSLEGEDYPSDPTPAWTQIRQATLEGDLSVPELSLDDDIGGYAEVKKRIKDDILDILGRKEALDDPKTIARIEGLIPRGMIFWGPPGTGKTLFAKAIASALGAAVQIVNGPELKSRWVGESEENLRRIFIQARQSAPSLIVFDELDSFAAQRGTYTGSGVEHSMVNQLLTEMDGFRNNELVFVVGTTNFVESIDSALLRPGRFEFHLHIPYPGAEDREAILKIYDQRLGLNMNAAALTHAVRQTGHPIEGSDTATGRWSGDHVQALCRAIARKRLRDARDQDGDETTIADVEDALTANLDLPTLTPEEERTVATHECGHAIVALHTEHTPAIDRISIRGDLTGALGFVRYADPAHKYVITHAQILDMIATLFGGREAEEELLGTLTIGASHDLERATAMARGLVERYGMSVTGELEIRSFSNDERLAEATKTQLDADVKALLERERARARKIIQDNRGALEVLRDLLLEKKVIDAKTMSAVVPTAKTADA